MAFNGSGVFQRIYSWVTDAANGINITDSRMDAEMDGLATGLSNCITKDGQTTVTANLPMATYRHTGVGNAAARTDYAAAGQVQDGSLNWVDGGGTADAITATYSPALTALVDGQLCFVRATAANATTTPTFSPNSLTARTIVKNGGAALVAGDIVGDGHQLILRYDLANTRWELLNPKTGTGDVAGPASSTANAIALFDGAGGKTIKDSGYTITAAGAAILDDVDAAAQRATLGLVIGTDVLAPNGSGTGLSGVGLQGMQTIWIPASAMVARTTNGAASGSSESSTNKVMTKSLDFDTATQEFAQFNVRFPKSWDEGTVTFAPVWTAASGSGGVVWGLQGVALSDDDAIDTAYGTAQTSTDTLITANDIHVGPTSSDITIAGTPAVGDLVSFQIDRTVSNGSDTLGADARLLGVALFFTTNAGNDA